MHKTISEVFDVTPVPNQKLPVVVTGHTTIEQDASDARDNLRSLMETAKVALENALNVAIQSESARTYEVVANLINTAADLNTKLLNTHQVQNKLVTEKPVVATQNNTTNNVVFTGTPSELAKLLKGNNTQ